MNITSKIKDILKEHILKAPYGIYFTRNQFGDEMETICVFDSKTDDGVVSISICEQYGYFEVIGINDTERKILAEYYKELI